MHRIYRSFCERLHQFRLSIPLTAFTLNDYLLFAVLCNQNKCLLFEITKSQMYKTGKLWPTPKCRKSSYLIWSLGRFNWIMLKSSDKKCLDDAIKMGSLMFYLSLECYVRQKFFNHKLNESSTAENIYSNFDFNQPARHARQLVENVLNAFWSDDVNLL